MQTASFNFKCKFHTSISASSPVAFKGGRGKREKILCWASHISISHHALPGDDITATDLYSLQLHCTVPNEGPAEEAASILYPNLESLGFCRGSSVEGPMSRVRVKSRG